MSRTNLKPRGYAGDSEMMRMIYSNDYEGESTFAKLIHKHPIEQPGAEAVRNRRNTITSWINSNRKKRKKEAPLQVLSVACGPANELLDVFTTKTAINELSFTLFDQDSYALLEAARLVDDIEKNIGKKLSLEYLRESVRTMIVAPQLSTRWGQFHLIYSMGLFDYLTPPVAKAVLGKIYQLLMPGGELMVGNFHESNPSRHYMDYWLDWPIYYRSEDDLRELAADINPAELSIDADKTGIQLFFRIKKGA